MLGYPLPPDYPFPQEPNRDYPLPLPYPQYPEENFPLPNYPTTTPPRTNTTMGNQTSTPTIACLWGEPYLDIDGQWKCPSNPNANQDTPATTNTPTTASGIVDYAKANPLVALGAVGLLIYLLKK